MHNILVAVTKKKPAPKKKAPLKSELVEEYNDLQTKYDVLDEENKQNVVMIKSLMSKLEAFERRENGDLNDKNRPILASVTVQTETILSCQKCDFQVNDIYEFYGHRWTEHEDDELGANMNDTKHMDVSHGDSQTEPPEEESMALNEFECNFCDENFTTKRNLMNHNKREHAGKVANCWKFAAGTCHYGNHCWFSHTIIDQEPKQFKCNECGKSFITPSEFHLHKKQDHKQLLPTCRNAQNGKCRFGELLCWFNHDVTTKDVVEPEKTTTYHQEVFDKLFGMIENISERVVHIETVK